MARYDPQRTGDVKGSGRPDAGAMVEALVARLEDVADEEGGEDVLPADWTAEQRAAWHDRRREFDARWAAEQRQCKVWLQGLRDALGSDEAFLAFLHRRVRAYDPANPHTRWAIDAAQRRALEEGRAITDEQASQECWQSYVWDFARNQVIAQRTPETVIGDERYCF